MNHQERQIHQDSLVHIRRLESRVQHFSLANRIQTPTSGGDENRVWVWHGGNNQLPDTYGSQGSSG